MEIKLTKWQTKVWDDPTRFKVLVCGRRAGKTTFSVLRLIYDANKESSRFPWWYAAPTYRQAKQIAWNLLKYYATSKIRDPKYDNETDLSIRLRKTGNTIALRGLDNAPSLEGIGLNALIADEVSAARNWNEAWGSSLRPMLMDNPKSWADFISKPRGYNHFHTLAKKGDWNNIIEGEPLEPIVKDKDYITYRFTTYDNQHISKEEIEKYKKEFSEDYFNQEVLAKFSKYTGLVYKEFQREVHVIEPFDIPESWSIYRSFDWGDTNPTVCLWIAVDNDENWFILNEHYEPLHGHGYDYLAGVVNANPFSKRHIMGSYADPSDPTAITELSLKGIYITPANKEVGTNFNSWIRFGIEKVSERLKLMPEHIVASLLSQKHNESGNRYESMPSLFIFRNCTNLIREFETYRWKEKSVTQAQDLNEPDVPEKANDHCFTSETMILTKTGWRRIDKIKKGEYVWSPFGWNEVYRAGSTGNKRVKDYGVFRCTPDHKVLTDRGLIDIDKLRYFDKLMVWNKSKPPTLMEFLIDAIQTPKTELIGFTFNALLTKSLMARRNFYTEMYGNSTMVKFLMAIWFIILTGILGITTLTILSLSLLVNTLKSIIGVFGKGQKNIWTRLDYLLHSGTSQRRGESSMYSWVIKPGKEKKGLFGNALYAGVNTPLIFRLGANSVVEPVKPRPSGAEEVFNLATRFGMYFANGVLVSNSMDSLRYFAVSYKKPSPMWILPKDDISNRNWSLE